MRKDLYSLFYSFWLKCDKTTKGLNGSTFCCCTAIYTENVEMLSIHRHTHTYACGDDGAWVVYFGYDKYTKAKC